MRITVEKKEVSEKQKNKVPMLYGTCRRRRVILYVQG